MQACHSASSSSSMLSTAMRRMPQALALPRTRRERPRHRAAEQRDELPASHSRHQRSKPRTASCHSDLDLGTG